MRSIADRVVGGQIQFSSKDYIILLYEAVNNLTRFHAATVVELLPGHIQGRTQPRKL